MADQADNSKYKRIFISGEVQSDFELAVAFIPLKYGEDKLFIKEATAD